MRNCAKSNSLRKSEKECRKVTKCAEIFWKIKLQQTEKLKKNLFRWQSELKKIVGNEQKEVAQKQQQHEK